MTSDLARSVIDIYRAHANEFDRNRTKSLMERPYLDAVINHIGEGRRILDLGCGSGEPIARYFIDAGYTVTGIDASPAMLAMCRDRFPGQTWIEGDMRDVELPMTFDGVIAWDSFFHLSQVDQRLMIARFASWMNSGGVLLFTSGPEAGEAIGELYGHSLYHSSLSPEEYRVLLYDQGFEVLSYTPNDPVCGGHTVWLTRKN